MTIVIADTSPLNYLILIDAIEVLPEMYGEVIISSAVLEELRHPGAPEAVQRWTKQLPAWIKVKSPGSVLSYGTALGRGETDAISLGSELTASLLLLDDRAARWIAAKKTSRSLGTIGILERAAEQVWLTSEPPFSACCRRISASNRKRSQMLWSVLPEKGVCNRERNFNGQSSSIGNSRWTHLA